MSQRLTIEVCVVGEEEGAPLKTICNEILVGGTRPSCLVGGQAPPSLVLRSTLSSAMIIYSCLPGFPLVPSRRQAVYATGDTRHQSCVQAHHHSANVETWGCVEVHDA